MTAHGLLTIDRHAPPWMVWSWAARDGVLAARTHQAGTLVRASRNLWVQDSNGIYHEAADNAPASGAYFDTVSGLYKFGGLAARMAGQELGTRSTDITNDTAFGWNNSGRFTFSNAASLIGGHVAKRALNDNTAGSTARTIALGTPGAVTRTIWILVENVDALVCSIGMSSSIDVFTSGIRAELTFASGAVALAAGAGTVTAWKVSPTVWLLAASRTMVAGHGYTGVYYLTGTAQNAFTTICHGAGVVDVTHPLVIPTVGAALSVNADALTWPLDVTPAQLAATGVTYYEAFIVERALNAALLTDCAVVGGTEIGGNNALSMYTDGPNARTVARWQTPGGTQQSNPTPAGFAAAYVPGAFIERSATVTPLGVATASVRVNRGAVSVGFATAAIGYPAAWASNLISLVDQVTTARKGHRLQKCAGLGFGVRSLDDMAEVCA